MAKRYGCPKCQKTYKHQTSLYKHINHECGVVPRFTCHLCNYAGKRKYHLKRHYMCCHKIQMRTVQYQQLV
ncbi:unnamed protein product [Phaedon cochleariae]|uniref:C2H2-type domain-containing protein n=1 Tax=Phaedon cochleariae TaxID=80249 RepID=A0A9P0DN57_PHACE|nr:unnamed protein product [Phaedon cochleariae]